MSDFTNDPVGFWGSFGTMSAKYQNENENSAFEGVQPWSGITLWGGATDRKAVVDHGIYLYSTNLAAADAYFLDKNYNQTSSPLNKYSWVPVTTIDSTQVIQNGNNNWPVNSSYEKGTWNGTDNQGAFYIAPAGFGDANGSEASPGMSLLRKPENTLNNFFYGFPTGSKFIQAYPATPWTLGIARNSNFMRKWAGAMMRKEWREARDSALFQPANWNAMAMAAALSGVPFNPGDQPFKNDGSERNPAVKNYLERLWSSWVIPTQAPGQAFSPNPPFNQTNILSFLLAIDAYGTPDWTYIARITDASGKEISTSIVYTAAFSKTNADGSVKTTLFAFNPGHETRYVQFFRLNADGSVISQPVSGTKPVAVPAKKFAAPVALNITPK